VDLERQVLENLSKDVWEVSTSGKGKDVGKRCRRVNIVQYCVHMYVNGKVRPVETIPGWGRKG
jgi:hypothetical protein